MVSGTTMDTFRVLYHRVMEYEGDELYADVLEPAISAVRSLLIPLHKFRRLSNSPPEQVFQEELFEFFALSVLNDFLLLPMRVSKGEYRHFFQSLGFLVFDPGEIFTPLLHEIVDVRNWPKVEEGISVGMCYWPGLQWGEMIFSRCAVDVFCHPSHAIIKGIADRSHLYFTNRRMHREVSDSSHGWGSNSRWATPFRRNYITGEYVFVNVDADKDIGNNNSSSKQIDSLPIEAARELLLHRCFVHYAAPGSGEEEKFWPYGWRMALMNTVPFWPLNEANLIPFDHALRAVGAHKE